MTHIFYFTFVLLLFVSGAKAEETPFIILKAAAPPNSIDPNVLAFSPDGKKVLVGAADKSVLICDAISGKELLKLEGEALYAAFSPDSKKVITADFGTSTRIWDVDSGKKLHNLEGGCGHRWSVVMSPDGKKVIASTRTVTRIWDTESGKELQKIEGLSFPICAFSPDGKKIVTANRDDAAQIWDADTGQELRKLEEPERVIDFVAFSPDGTTVLTVSREKPLPQEVPENYYIARIWDADTGRERHKLEGVKFAVFTPDGKQIIARGMNEKVRIWDTVSGNVLHHFGRLVRTIAVSPAGKKIVTGHVDGPVQVWDVDSGMELLAMKGQKQTVISTAFSPDGKKVATACFDDVVRIWDLDTFPPPVPLERPAMMDF